MNNIINSCFAHSRWLYGRTVSYYAFFPMVAMGFALPIILNLKLINAKKLMQSGKISPQDFEKPFYILLFQSH